MGTVQSIEYILSAGCFVKSNESSVCTGIHGIIVVINIVVFMSESSEITVFALGFQHIVHPFCRNFYHLFVIQRKSVHNISRPIVAGYFSLPAYLFLGTPFVDKSISYIRRFNHLRFKLIEVTGHTVFADKELFFKESFGFY